MGCIIPYNSICLIDFISIKDIARGAPIFGDCMTRQAADNQRLSRVPFEVGLCMCSKLQFEGQTWVLGPVGEERLEWRLGF
jgi:hypothetical protein